MSGGHQHEGMSSADSAVIIRLSDLGDIEYNSETYKSMDSSRNEAWGGLQSIRAEE